MVPMKQEEPTPLLIVGAAMSRTGTMSLKRALERLGYKVFHGENFFSGQWPDLFTNLAIAEKKGRDSNIEIAAIVAELSKGGYTACLDFPIAALYQELAEYYPQAKVLLTTRSDVNRWAQSVRLVAFRLGVILHSRPFRWMPPFNRISDMKDWLWQVRMEVPNEEIESNEGIISVETAMEMYHRYVGNVKKTIDPENLVVYSVKEGWDPLCHHFLLNGECPEEPFPHVNQMSGGSARIVGDIMEIISLTWPLILAALLWLCSIIARQIYQALKGGTKTVKKE